MAEQTPDFSGLVVVVNMESGVVPLAQTRLRFVRPADSTPTALGSVQVFVALHVEAVLSEGDVPASDWIPPVPLRRSRGVLLSVLPVVAGFAVLLV